LERATRGGRSLRPTLGDPVTYDMALQILEDEIMHEEDLETIQNDIHVMEAKLQR